MISYAVFSIVEYRRDQSASLAGSIIAVAVFLLLAGFYLRLSLRVGDFQRRRREKRRRKGKRAEDDRAAPTDCERGESETPQ
jgi:hypothetical protein